METNYTYYIANQAIPIMDVGKHDIICIDKSVNKCAVLGKEYPLWCEYVDGIIDFGNKKLFTPFVPEFNIDDDVKIKAGTYKPLDENKAYVVTNNNPYGHVVSIAFVDDGTANLTKNVIYIVSHDYSKIKVSTKDIELAQHYYYFDSTFKIFENILECDGKSKIQNMQQASGNFFLSKREIEQAIQFIKESIRNKQYEH